MIYRAEKRVSRARVRRPGSSIFASRTCDSSVHAATYAPRLLCNRKTDLPTDRSTDANVVRGLKRELHRRSDYTKLEILQSRAQIAYSHIHAPFLRFVSAKYTYLPSYRFNTQNKFDLEGIFNLLLFFSLSSSSSARAPVVSDFLVTFRCDVIPSRL